MTALTRRAAAGLAGAMAALLAGWGAFLPAAQAAPAPAAPAGAGAGQPTVLTSGHMDLFNIAAGADGSISLNLKEDATGTGVERAPEETVVGVVEKTFTTKSAVVPQLGTPGFLLDQVQQYGIVWPGWDSGAARQLGGTAVRFVVEQLEGPGKVFLWETNFATLNPILRDAAGAPSFQMVPGSVIAQSEPAHQHANWLFSAPGTYRMTVRAEVDTPGGTLTSSARTYTWAVGDAAIAAAQGHDNGGPGSGSDSGNDGAAGAPGDSSTPDGGTAPEAGAGGSGAAPSGTPTGGVNGANGGNSANGANGAGGANGAPAPGGGATQAPSGQAPAAQAPQSPAGQAAQAPAAPVCIPTPVERAASGGASGSHTIPANTHVHPNWVFTQPGTYTVGLALNATAKDGTRLSTTTTLTFNVGGSGTANSGHYDLGAVVDGGQLRAAVKDDNSGQWLDPASLSFGLGEAAATTAPAGIDFVAGAGERIYMISSSQVSGVPWLGANTQHPSFREATTGELTLSVTSVSGPGKMAVFESGTFGQLVGQQWFGSSGGGTETVWEGRTADGQPCELSPEQIAQLEREGKKLGNNLAHSGSEVIDPLAVTLALLCVGGVVLYTRKRA
ncbi:choice-of-anchor M domain-containing protein [Actinotignum timonense]|uniref:choice-of-anchor M domain-containing protein n=1 Tax=Actinotignum TaxID=1653174 RepID=UPI00237D8D7B|nr:MULTISPECIES: choice-of-anchor M domain-containing protein [Actinotignum]MDE1553739.1 choice-of-anchor M domain-containing protein [Actinotignum sanguinis]MDE1565142.1 choice-of-anchor M domain-containing protein [Actinotignum sanguinis]MDE1577662.1 choice-of-anchor M domain-containing protein [Actinotignum sanguinis]MDE1642117.1 choice-of-anchor M domain-containing protein [Actinotignum sanguinis]MDE1655242.1 choice-of-anchor M domain-containing protein [Actinotignum schaalii]